MNKRALSLAVFVAGAYPAASHALGLGDIESNSHLNQPLRARIELLAATPADASKIQVRLASPDVFNRVGVARPDFLNNLNFTPTVQGGKPVILVTSDTPIQEPFVNFLLEVSWPQGQLLKEYTVMLDPPVMLQPSNTVAGGEASVRAEPKAVGTVRRQHQTQAEVDSALPEQPRQLVQANPNKRTYRVKPGDTLFRVASRLQQPGISNEQMMIALFRANPGAFINRNINNLRSGVVLKAPSFADVGKTSRAEARRQIRQQNAEWREFRQTLAKATVPQNAGNVADTSKPNTSTGSVQANNKPDRARLEVLGAKSGTSAPSDAAVAASAAKLSEMEQQLALAREALSARQKENEELKSRISDLESMLSKKNRLIDLRNEQLASLQKQLSDNGIKTNPLTDADVSSDNNTAANTAAALPTKPAPTPDEINQNEDLPAHLANTVGKEDNEVLRSEQPAERITPSPVEPQQTVTPPANIETQPGGAASAQPAESTPAPLTPPPLVPPPSLPPAALIQPPEVAATEPPATNTAVKPAPVFADQQNDEGLMELLTSPLAMQLGAGALALLLLLWLLGRRHKANAIDDRSTGSKRSKQTATEAGVAQAVANESSSDINGSSADLSSNRFKGNTGADVFGGGENSPWDNIPSSTNNINAQGAYDNGNDTPYTESPEEDDLLTEASVYIAYGLYQQAESELKKGIERHPENLAYRHKLLECYFVANNREAFDRQAEQFAALDGHNKATLWKNIVEWGRKISPDNMLYHNSDSLSNGMAIAGTVGASAAAAVASAAFAQTSNHDSVASDLDFSDDLLLDHHRLQEVKSAPVPQETPQSESLPANEQDDLGDLDFSDIDLDKLLQGDERPATQHAAEVTPTVTEVAAASQSTSGDTDLLDLDFDFDKPFDEDTSHTAPRTLEQSTASVDDDNLLDFLTEDLDESSAPEVNALNAPAAQPAPEIPATNLNLHLDNSNLNRILPKDTFYAPADNKAAAGKEEDWLGDIDDALSFLDFPDDEIDLHEAHISTKLDLARAYLDMGDIEGARSTLEEVMVEGNDDQRREAEVLLHQTG